MSRSLHHYRLPLLQHLQRSPDVALTVYCGESSQPGQASSGDSVPVPVVWLANRLLDIGRIRLVWQGAARRLLRGSYDVVICPEAVHNLTVWAVWFLRRFSGKRLVIHGFGYRSGNTDRVVPSLQEGLRSLLLRGADAIICYTEMGRRACLARGLPPEKLFVSNNTLDTRNLIQTREELNEETMARTRAEWGLQGQFVVGHVGRLRSFNRLDVVIEAVHQLADVGRQVALLVVGDGPARAELETQSAGLANVRFLGPIYEEDQLAPLFALSDVLVRPVRIGLTCVHALAYGVPVMTASASVAEQTPEYEYIVHRHNGVIVDSLESSDFAEAILGLMDRPEQLDAMKSRARETAASLTVENMGAQFLRAVHHAARR